jgi:hypothetical protein
MYTCKLVLYCTLHACVELIPVLEELELILKCRIDFCLFGLSKVELIPIFRIDSCLVCQKLEIVVFDFRIDFYTKFFYSAHFCINISKLT